MGIPENQKYVYGYKEPGKMRISNMYAYIVGPRDPQQVCIHGLLQ